MVSLRPRSSPSLATRTQENPPETSDPKFAALLSLRFLYHSAPPFLEQVTTELGEPLPLDRGPGPTQTDPPSLPWPAMSGHAGTYLLGGRPGPSAAVSRWRGHWRCRRGGCARRRCRPGGARHPELGTSEAGPGRPPA